MALNEVYHSFIVKYGSNINRLFLRNPKRFLIKLAIIDRIAQFTFIFSDINIFFLLSHATFLSS